MSGKGYRTYMYRTYLYTEVKPDDRNAKEKIHWGIWNAVLQEDIENKMGGQNSQQGSAAMRPRGKDITKSLVCRGNTNRKQTTSFGIVNNANGKENSG